MRSNIILRPTEVHKVIVVIQCNNIVHYIIIVKGLTSCGVIVAILIFLFTRIFSGLPVSHCLIAMFLHLFCLRAWCSLVVQLLVCLYVTQHFMMLCMHDEFFAANFTSLELKSVIT